jgi:hypothetical protein
MNMADWIIQLSIFGVLAAAVIGTFQNVIAGLREAWAGKGQDQS